MNNIFIIAIVIAIIYLIGKFIEMRFILKENKPFSLLFRDTLLVYFSVVIGYFILEQIKPMIQEGGTVNGATQVFTDNPAF
jgi:hypothetical protein